MGPVHVGVRSKAQVHHHPDGPGLLGAAISPAVFYEKVIKVKADVAAILK